MPAELSNAHVAFMLEHDAFSRWLGIVVEEVRPGYCRLHLKIRADMLNGFGMVVFVFPSLIVVWPLPPIRTES